MNVVQFSIEPLLRVAQAFPATPRLMIELGGLLRRPETDLADVTRLLKADNALAARLLRVANSAAFSPAEHIASIDDAAALIGFREIHRLVGAVAIDQFSSANYPLYGIPGRRLRENALFVALLMEELARVAHQDPHAAYTTGLFRSVGKLALEKLAAEVGTVTAFNPAAPTDLIVWEKHTFGITGNEATAAILLQWRFPAEIPKAIAEHYQPVAGEQPPAWLLHLAASLADQQGYGLPGESHYWSDPEKALRETKVDADRSRRATERAKVAFDRLSAAMG
jgi:HD-like signal output (HDOD) protein